MTVIARRSLLIALAAAPAVYASRAYAVDALPDARFVGFAQAVNDFGIRSGQLALAKSANENIRGYATRAVSEYTEAASYLSKSRSEAGVSYAPDPNGPPNAQRMLPQLNALQGADFDAAYANAQLAVQTEAVDQFGAFSQNGSSAPLRRYAQMMLPKSKMFLEYAKRLAGSR
jgi:putative membrane protein